jgi:SAM-dependent methyltransferase
VKQSKIKTLVAIANFGLKNTKYLEKLLKAYRSMINYEVHIVVLSDIPKIFGPDVEVRVGLPDRDPWSLPFGYKELFASQVECYDLFIYSEDDTLIEEFNIDAFLEVSKMLPEKYIAGFLRYEISPEGTKYYSTIHGHFYWDPNSVQKIGEYIFAHYTNDHSACFILTRQQLKKAIASGGFLLPPRKGRYDMLVTAATDPYTQCGMKKVVCISHLNQFSLPHLPNKYTSLMGLPAVEMEWQLDALRKIYAGELPKDAMANPETKFPLAFGSKSLREDPDPILSELIADVNGLILVWGAGDGKAEHGLCRPDRRVGVVAVNAVMAECCRRRGLLVLGAGRTLRTGPETAADAVVIVDILHLVDDPAKELAELREWLKSSGRLVIRVPNFRDVRMIRRRWENPDYRLPLTREATGVTAFKTDQLASILSKAGFGNIQIKTPVAGRFQKANRLLFGLVSQKLASEWYAMAQKH